MHVVANIGSNVSHTALGHYGMWLAQEHVVLDTPPPPSPAAGPDRPAPRSQSRMAIVAASEPAWRALFLALAKTDVDVLAVVTSRKLGVSFANAVAAAASIGEDARLRAQIRVVDSRTTDVATALLALVAGEARKARMPVALALQTLDILVQKTVLFWTPVVGTLVDRPVHRMVDGETSTVARIPGKGDPIDELVSQAFKAAGQPTKVWAGIGHDATPVEAMKLHEALLRRTPVGCVYRRALASTSQPHLGPGALALALVPLDDLPWVPATPPDFSETRLPVRRPRSLV